MTKSLKVLQTLFAFLVILSLVACGGAQPTTVDSTSEPAATTEATEAPAAEPVTLTLGSWRTDDAEAWGKILEVFHASHPDITVKFDPTNPPDYNATLRTQLETGT